MLWQKCSCQETCGTLHAYMRLVGLALIRLGVPYTKEHCASGHGQSWGSWRMPIQQVSRADTREYPHRCGI